jgi:methylenetetrahydrofolate reductase (NADPH)
MKIIDKINSQNDLYYSFEYYPPKTLTGQQNLYFKLEKMASYEPLFIDLTWGAGGSTSKLTLDMCINMQNKLCLETQMHLTCTNINKEIVTNTLKKAKDNNIQNILALRGDPSELNYNKESENNDLNYAVDLVKFIRKEYGSYFGISVAGYPEGHPDAKSYQQDLIYLKQKVDAGADYIITQFFFDVKLFFKYVEDCRNIGITCPIIPGILPIINFRSFKRMIGFCKTKVSDEILTDLEKIKNNDEEVANYGVKLAIKMCKDLINNGVKGIHFYTLNRDDCTFKILNNLNLLKNVSEKRNLPWRSKIGSDEEIRPIFWANAVDNYLTRTNEWEHFPNGRWSDNRNSNYGEIKDYHLFTVDLGSKKNKLKMWKSELKDINDIADVFVNFLENKIKYLPWCDNIAIETSSIKNELIKINKLKYFTINSQPKLNGIKSESSDGWGGKGGYLYQKAYIEFFTSKNNLDNLTNNINTLDYNNYTYCAINKEGNVITNCNNSITALTWGVFPKSEIIQPTIADNESFKIWKTDAFNLWLTEWGKIYEKESNSYKILNDIYNNYYLVYIIDNDYINGNIFNIFNIL